MAATPLVSSALTPSTVVTTTPRSDLMAKQTNSTTTINVHGNENLMSITNETHDDHLYLSSKFYNNKQKNLKTKRSMQHVQNGNNHVHSKSNGITMNGGKIQTEFIINTTRPSFVEIAGSSSSSQHHHHSNHGVHHHGSNQIFLKQHQNTLNNNHNTLQSSDDTSSTFIDDDYIDEDSNTDTQSCSSSSGCSSSSNSMVGSVNRHLSLNVHQNSIKQQLTTTTTIGYPNILKQHQLNGSTITNNMCHYTKDLTPKQVKRRLDWDSPPTSASPPESSNTINSVGVLSNGNPVATTTAIPVAKTTMTAVNGKPVSVRTFKLTNAMKQSLVASGCSQAVAVAAVAAAFHTNGGANQQQSQHHSPDRLITATAASCGSDPGICPVTSAITPAVTPTAVQIVTNISELSPSSPTIAIVNSSPTQLAQRTTNGSFQTATASNSMQRHQTQNDIFKTPLAPSTPSTANGHSQSPQNSAHRFYIVNNGGESEMKTHCLNIKSKNSTAVRLTPILANTVVKQQQSSGNQRSNKRVRTIKKESNFEDSVTESNSPRVNYIRGRPMNGAMNGPNNGKSNSFESSLPYSPSPDLSSSPIMMSEDGDDCGSNIGDLFINTSSGSTFGGNGYYGNGGLPSTSSLSSSYPYSPSSSSSSDFAPHHHQQHTNTSNSTGRKSGRTRYETSLGQLTRKFISLLQESADGSINLNDASDVLQVQKRRIYDITNVLEGVGLLHKTSKNNIQWRGGIVDYFSGRNPSDLTDQTSHYRNRRPPPLSLLFNENSNESNSDGYHNNHSVCSSSSQSSSIDHRLSELENDENRLDHLLSVARDNLNRVKLDPYLYASYNDLRKVPQFHDQTVIGIRPPLDTELLVSDPSESLQIRLKNSRRQMIEVYLCPPPNDDETNNGDPTLANYEFQSTTLDEQLQTAPTLIRSSSSSPPVNEIIPVDANPEELVTETATNQAACHSDMQNTESGYHSYYGSGSIQTPVRTSMTDTTRMATNSGNGSIHKSHQSQHVIQSPNKCSSVYDDNDSQIIVKSEPSSSHDSYAHAFICHDDEFGPFGSRTYMTQTEDQITLKSSSSSPISRQNEHSGNSSATPNNHDHSSNNNNNNNQTHRSSHHHSHYHSSLSHCHSSPIMIPLEPPVTNDADDYNFTLCDNEGIAELFDDNGLSFDI
ncbi:uncharacterized protein LOC113789148 [Dermatophagoides pteronyssinus]|uniref:uncharacterized protein LOC113789148 n=1 Tax=Dermatophagoides pteronyssinus TaxID=6956 RepID=UPI003F668F72